MAHEAADPVDRRLGRVGVDVYHRRRHLAAVDGENRGAEVPAPVRGECLAFVVRERHRHVRVRERVLRDDAVDMIELRRRLPEKLPARRRLAKQVAHLNDRAGRAGRRLNLADRAVVDDDAVALVGVGRARADRDRRRTAGGPPVGGAGFRREDDYPSGQCAGVIPPRRTRGVEHSGGLIRFYAPTVSARV